MERIIFTSCISVFAALLFTVMGEKVVATNKKARFDYHISDTIEAGIVLMGTEVKSLRDGRANLKDSYATIEAEEIFLIGVHISPYSHGSTQPHDPERKRKLLLHKSEIRKLKRKVDQKGITIIPLKIYFKNGKAKVLIGSAKGKAKYDKRREIADREAKREIARSSKNRI